MSKKRQSSFTSNTSLTTSSSECYSGCESLQLSYSNRCSQSSPLSNVFKKFKLSSENNKIDTTLHCEDIISNQNFVRCSTPILLSHNSFNDSLERHFSQFKEEEGLLLNSSYENIENKSIKELNCTEIVLKNTLQHWKSFNVSEDELVQHFSNPLDSNDTLISAITTGSNEHILTESIRTLKDSTNFQSFNISGHELSKNESLWYKSEVIQSLRKEASIKYVSQTGDSINELYIPPGNTNEKNSLCDFTEILEDVNTKSFNINEDELVDHFSKAQNSIQSNISSINTKCKSASIESDGLQDVSHIQTTFNLDVNETELGTHFSQLHDCVTVFNTSSSGNSESINVADESDEISKDVSHNKNTFNLNIHEAELGKHFSQLQTSVAESLLNTESGNSSNGLNKTIENMSYVESTLSLNIDDKELDKHFSQLENRVSLVNTKYGKTSGESDETTLSENVSHVQSECSLNINKEKLGKQFNQLQSSNNESITFLVNTEHGNESDDSIDLLDNISHIQNINNASIKEDELVKHFSQPQNHNISLNSRNEDISAESDVILENTSCVQSAKSFNVNEDELAKHFSQPQNESSKEFKMSSVNTKDKSLLDESDETLKDPLQMQTPLQFHDHLSQLHNNEFDLIEVCEKNKSEDTLDNPSDNRKEEMLTEEVSEIMLVPNLIPYLEETGFTSSHTEPTDQVMITPADYAEEVSLIDMNELLETSAATHSENIEVLKNKLQTILLWFIKQLTEKKYPVLTVIKGNCWNNCVFENNLLKLKPHNDIVYSRIKYYTKTGRQRFNLIIYLIAKMYLLLLINSTCTQREIYYQLKNYLKTQAQIAKSLIEISSVLNIEPWYLPIVATSKGLVFGDLTLINTKEEVITCNIFGGILIPQDLKSIREFKSNAAFVLIVEKDTIFKRLLEDISDKLEKPFILITGKGYPDINTRLLVKSLYVNLKIPIYILVDADPHGINIMLTYRFGSLNMARFSEQLAVPSMHWLGIFPSEIQSLNITHQLLGEKDQNKIHHMLKRPYINANPWLKRELEVLQNTNVKAEIEGVIKNKTFLTDVYLTSKIFNQDYI